jgi:hypothetical protein
MGRKWFDLLNNRKGLLVKTYTGKVTISGTCGTKEVLDNVMSIY